MKQSKNLRVNNEAFQPIGGQESALENLFPSSGGVPKAGRHNSSPGGAAALLTGRLTPPQLLFVTPNLFQGLAGYKVHMKFRAY